MLRGEIWIVNLDPTIGAEIKKSRPIVIVGNDRIGKLPLRIIVPLTDWKEGFSVAEWLVKIEPDNINNLNKISAADAFQVRSTSIQRFDKKLGELSDKKMQEIEKALAIVLKIETL
jgi:mRNA interferase MazF